MTTKPGLVDQEVGNFRYKKHFKFNPFDCVSELVGFWIYLITTTTTTSTDEVQKKYL